jgi:hypothetical protein
MEYPMENEQCFECKGKGIVPSKGCDSELNNGYDECYVCSGEGMYSEKKLDSRA